PRRLPSVFGSPFPVIRAVGSGQQRAIDGDRSHSHARRAGDGVGKRSGGGDGGRLADSFGIERSDWRRHLYELDVVVRDLVGGGHLIVEEGAGAQLAVAVVDELLPQGATERLGGAAVDLALDLGL